MPLLSLAGAALVASCAALPPTSPGSPVPSGAAADTGTESAAVIPLTVASLRGTASVEDGTRRKALKPAATVGENQPVQVGAGSQLRLELGGQAQIDLGAGARLVVHRLPLAERGGPGPAWLRLERGQMRLVWSDDADNSPAEVSFARWAAQLGPGEYFFEGDGKTASACAARGQIQLSGVPEWTPPTVQSACAKLAAREAPRVFEVQEEHWLALRGGRSIERTLARAEQQQLVQQRAEHARAERARLEQEREARRKERELAAVAAAMDAELKREEARAAAEEARLKREAAQRDRDAAVAAAEAAQFELERAREAAQAERLLQEARAAAEREAELDAQRAAAQAEVEAIAHERLREREIAARPTAPAMPDSESPIDVPSYAAPAQPPQITLIAPTPEPMSEPIPESSSDGLYVQPMSPEEYAASQQSDVTTPADPPLPESGAAAEPAAPAGGASSTFRLDEDLAAPAATPAPPAAAPAPQAQEFALAPPADVAPDPAPDASGLPEPVPLPKPEWIVNVQTYGESAPAEKQAELLGTQGLPAMVRYETVRGRPSFRVVIEGLPTAEAAEAMVADLRSRLDIDSAWSLRRR